ncbi:hypothetical protein LTR91_013685 [Friedmanniomyces endolithicus]|uniref:RING-type domain-containing protein n=1 Tax=Friedmanniomyces endolithicus TaxID=329885 RepID=A0AAN6KD45_9PEZI|nr:hypothetical protein LTR94_009772 [Friedmanniomyces endolithicus]KAK0796280.1 hypothetical protein LTR38_008571 [Friedmanniomyces endolithicus]KAK0805600.1 hypothetical protein LTR75_007272 [Friedmanniomyces endolithicus]KAK0811389.1 hypothetical protein LTR59_001842 [Friedmanniomyces endolithicus]KAK0843180.1 hypothetical protein LTR03_008836 [Friedmanniomyces endolithicus]
MAETCIVCLGDLRNHVADDDPPPEAAEAVAAADASNGDHAKSSMRTNVKSIAADEENIGHLLPCKHDLHNACLKPWVERANSCPICRAKFNMVEICQAVGGPVLDSYAVQDKVQESDLDPNLVLEDELFSVEAWTPCMVCGDTDDTHELMYCDGCEKAVHVFCAGHDETPDVWYCETCLANMETDIDFSGVATAVRRQPRRRPVAREARPRRRDNAIWARVWNEVSRTIDLDLDFPFDELVTEHDPPAFRRTLEPWQRRMEAAEQQGAATTRIRDIASARLQRAPMRTQPEPESQEQLRAWNAFEKARESQEAPSTTNRHKRKATASPVSPHEPDQPQPQLKRPRLRRVPNALEQHIAAESSHAAEQRRDERSTFLSSLLKDVETKPVSAGSPGVSEQYAGHWSPRDSSPARSPMSSGHATPRAQSPAPEHHIPISPPLSAPMLHASSPAAAIFSPFSPTDALHERRGRKRETAPDRRDGEDPLGARASSGSPSRNLSYSAKEEVQRMVKLALGPRYRDKEISKEQYTDINRDVSRKMYELVGDASALTDQTERERWQGVAEDEVKKAVSLLHFGPRTVDT